MAQGKKKYIETPEKLWNLFEAYKKETKENPRIKIEYVGKDGKRVETPIERPLTVEGFKTYCNHNASDISHYWYNSDGSYEDYRSIVTRIAEEIRVDQIEGGMIGQYNANLTARINGLREQTETVTHNVQLMNIDVLADSNDKPKIETKKKLK